MCVHDCVLRCVCVCVRARARASVSDFARAVCVVRVCVRRGVGGAATGVCTHSSTLFPCSLHVIITVAITITMHVDQFITLLVVSLAGIRLGGWRIRSKIKLLLLKEYCRRLQQARIPVSHFCYLSG